MHAHPDVLHSEFGLSADQISKLEAIRDNFVQKRITHKASKARIRVELRKEWRKDLPNEAKVLKQMRKMRNLRGKIQEERTKALLKALRLLSSEQRAQFRAKCMKMGPRRGGKGWGKGWGKGRGRRGGCPCGPGGGPGGPGGPGAW
jgi:Spy/CpxP family protein refolding chaperone